MADPGWLSRLAAISIAEIPIAVVIPPVIVLEPAAIAIPIPREELSTLITRPDPGRARIRWTGPIPVMPPVAVSDRVPIAIHPKVIRPRGTWPGVYDARRGRWPDSHANRNLRETRPPSQQN